MVLPTAEWASQVLPPGVAGVRKEPNSALRAESEAPLNLRMALQDRVQRGLILPDKRPGAIALMPICAKREELLDGYGKKARLSTIISIVLCTPSSYLFDANASRGRARFFCATDDDLREPPVQTVRHRSLTQAVRLAKSAQTRWPSDPETTTWKKEALFFFPSSMAIHLSREAAI